MFQFLTPGVESFLILFFAFAIGHALADFALQNAFISRSKVPGANLSDFFGTRPAPRYLWIHSLTAHSLIHAGAVWMVSGSPLLGLAELVLHWIIDLIKGLGLINFHADQILHLTCKLSYVVWILHSAV